MNIIIKYPAVKALQDLGLYYIFTTQRAAQHYHYQSLPAANLCLSIYKANTITRQLSPTENHCQIQPGRQVHSRLWGFHKRPFDVLVEGEMDQVSVIFPAGGLRRFTKIPYAELLPETDVLGMIFGRLANDLIEQVFATDQPDDRVGILDGFLGKALQCGNRQPYVDRFLLHLECQEPNARVVSLAATEYKDTSTLYRQFKQYVGQAPKEYLKVIRFRRALRALQQRSYRSLTDLAHELGYYDQSHFIKDFTLFADYNPGLIPQITTLVQNELILIPRG
ncbi:helix-turn-helix domain-containing protein [Paraflavitalea sp. CAU 1676]|uniref:AraC family transcriptional regulator n=1 Tax=Paraflavitalea sp. CAU 1676 TaxID=3032598 RepID=UPI0023DC2A25|nr:helix-turn-helix domain-containing protein [Paraflavitalea sp. CAU 1676]MDF2188414.1 helix-turn-helix domain-containing protein [Paraflavitalea sp. CAU 1676]